LSWELLTRPKSEGGLGFRDLYGFNMAMLAKQGWRMLINPESLCARVLKARYFPNSSVLEAKPSNGISYSWRSILKGINLLKEGLMRRIGDGTTVNIWSDPWLSREGCRTPITPRGQCVLTKVSELIDPITGQWDEELVRDIFWEMDVQIILATPIRDDFEDFPAWYHDSKGIFSVKSAYRVYIQLRDANLDTSSRNEEEKSHWKQIWDLPCLPKIKNFVWRLAHNSLPIMANIQHRGMECDTHCICCNGQYEDGAHLFLKCRETKALWKNIGMDDLRRKLSTYESAAPVIQEILCIKEEEKKLVVLCMLWRWWLQRNKKNKGGQRLSADEVIRQARYWVSESLQYCKKEKKEPKAVSPSQCWQKPTGEVLKINIDGAFQSANRTGGWGFVIRDNAGHARGSGAGRIEYVASAVQAEAVACSEALQASASWGMGHILLETDSLILASALKGTEYDLAPEGVLYRDMRSFLNLNFISFDVIHVPRSCNKVAHELAALGSNQGLPRLVWPECVPDDVHVLVASEFAEPV
jgi:hypothetical protein